EPSLIRNRADTLRTPTYADEIETSDGLTLWNRGNGQMRADRDATVLPFRQPSNASNAPKSGTDEPPATPRANRLDARVIPEIKEWAIAFVHRHWDAPDRDALLAQALGERLLNKYDVFPGDLEAAVEWVMDAVFRT